MRWRWPWTHVAEDTSDEAQAELEKLEERDDEVTRLGKQLQEAHRRNNFSSMVNEAISRKAREQGG